MIGALTENEIKEVPGGKADFSGVMSKVDITAHVASVGGDGRNSALDFLRRVLVYNATFR